MASITIRSLLLALVSVVLISCSKGPGEQERINNAQVYFQNKDFRKAIIELKNVLKSSPENAQARLLLGDVYLDVAEGHNAEKEFKRYEQYGGSKEETFFRIPRAWLNQKQFQKVLDQFAGSKETDKGKQATISLLKGQAYIGLKELDTALSEFMSGLKVQPDNSDLRLELSKLYLLRNDLDKALSTAIALLEDEKKNATAWYIQGVVFERQGNRGKAIESFEKAMAFYGQNSYGADSFNARITLIIALLQEKKLDAAKKHIHIALRLYPQNPIAVYTLAVYDYMNNNLDTSLEKLYKVVEALPGYSPPFLLKGAIHFSQGSYEQANNDLSRFVNEVPTHVQARKLLASTRIKLNRKKEALSVLSGIEDSQQDIELLSLMGHLSLSAGDGKTAIETLRRVSKQKPEDSQIRKALAAAYIKHGEYNLAIESLKELSSNEQEKAAFLLLEAYIRNGQYKQARSQAADMLQQDPNDARILTSAGVVELYAGKRYQARKYFSKASQQVSDGFIPAQTYLARMEIEDGNLRDAQNMFDQILLKEPANEMAHIGLAQIAEKQGKTKQAVYWVKTAHEKNKQALLPSILLSQHYIKNNRISKAILILSETRQYHADNQQLLILLARAYKANQDKKQAEEVLLALIDKFPKLHGAYIELADLQSKMKLYGKANKTLQKAMALKPNSMLNQSAVGALELQKGNISQALKIAKQIQVDNSASSVGYILSGDIYMKKKEYKEAQQSYRNALDRQSVKPVLLRLYNAYELDKKHKQAVALLEDWIKKHPDDYVTILDLANVYTNKGKTDKAIAKYKEILSRQADHLGALNNIALVYLDRSPQKALDYAKRAYAIGKQHPAVQDTLGWVYFKNGDIENALPLIKGAAKALANPSIQFHLAVVLEKTGEKDRARSILDKILREKRRFPEKSEAKALLEKL